MRIRREWVHLLYKITRFISSLNKYAKLRISMFSIGFFEKWENIASYEYKVAKPVTRFRKIHSYWNWKNMNKTFSSKFFDSGFCVAWLVRFVWFLITAIVLISKHDAVQVITKSSSLKKNVLFWLSYQVVMLHFSF